MVISQKDAFHSFFQHFSYNHMMEKIKSFVNCVLKEKSSAFLMKVWLFQRDVVDLIEIVIIKENTWNRNSIKTNQNFM